MSTIIEIIKRSEEYLSKKGVENPRLSAEHLLGRVLGCNRLNLYLEHNRQLTEGELSELRELIIRRGTREPLQYILGVTPFMDLELRTDPRALIPRPETEELVELILKTTKELGEHFSTKSIIDLGTGSGAIALALAKNFPAAHVWAADQSLEALTLAQENATLNNLQNISFIQSNWLKIEQTEQTGRKSGHPMPQKFDLIVSNPPYLSYQEFNSSQPEIHMFEPISALVSNQAGAQDLLTIIQESKNFLNSPGLLFLETGINHHTQLTQFANSLGFPLTKSYNDLSGRPRFLQIST